MDFASHAVGIPETLGIVAVLAAFIWIVRVRSRRRSARIKKEFLEQYPQASVLYLYVEDIPQNEGSILSQKGAVSPVFAAKDAPGYGVSQGIACYIAPGDVELELKAVWSEDFYVARRRRSIQTRAAFRVEAGRGYAVVMNAKQQTSKLMPLRRV